jgi:sec-independent protein translocase protein TatA
MFNDLFDSPWKILIIAAVVLILFGSRKMPDAARSLGRSMRILKSEVQGLHQEDEPQPTSGPQTQLTTGQQTSADQIEQLQQQVRDLQQQQAAAASGANSASTVEAQHTQQPS